MATNHQAPRAPTTARPAIEISPIETTPKALALVPSSLDGAMQLSRWLAMSSFLPDRLRGKEGDIFAILLAGSELGLPPMATLRGIYIVNGKPALEAKTKAAICLERGAAKYFRKIEDTPTAVTWETMRQGDTDPRRSRFTIQEAKAAGLTEKDGPWRLYPQRMLGHRALGWLCDDVYPDIVLGVSTAEDFEPAEYAFTPIAGGVELGTPRPPKTVSEPISLVQSASASAPPASPPPSAPSANPNTPAATAAPTTTGEPEAMTNSEVEDIVALMMEATDLELLNDIARTSINGSSKALSKEQRDYLARVFADSRTELKRKGGQK